MIIAFYNHMSGLGTTIHAAHACALAQNVGLRVAGVSVDFMSDLPRWLEGRQIPCLEGDLASRASAFDLLVMDIRSPARPPITPDAWVLIVCDPASEESAAKAADRLPGHLIWLRNKGYETTIRAPHLHGSHARRMPFSRALARAGVFSRIIWDDPDLAKSPGAADLWQSLEDVLGYSYEARGLSLFHESVAARLRRVAAGVAATRITVEANHAGLKSVLDLIKANVEVVRTNHAGLKSALDSIKANVEAVRTPDVAAEPEPVQEDMVPSPGEVLHQAVTVVDEGLSALIEQVRAQLRDEPSPLDYPAFKLASATGRQTVDAWLEALHRDGRELVCGHDTARELAQSLHPGRHIAYRARVHFSTIARFEQRPGRARLDTLVRIAVACDRADLLELRLRRPASQGDDALSTDLWPGVSSCRRTMN